MMCILGICNLGRKSQMNRFEIEFNSTEENMNTVLEMVELFLKKIPELSDIAYTDVLTCAREAIVNAIVHGYTGVIGIITLELVVHTDGLCLKVEDSGSGMKDVEKCMEMHPVYYAEIDECLLTAGFSFMKEFMDSVKVDSMSGRGTSVYMTKRFEEQF